MSVVHDLGHLLLSWIYVISFFCSGFVTVLFCPIRSQFAFLWHSVFMAGKCDQKYDLVNHLKENL